MQHATFLPKFFNIDLPDTLATEVLKCKTNDAIRQLGIEWGIQQAKELKAAGVPSLHFYTMSDSSSVKAIASEIY